MRKGNIIQHGIDCCAYFFPNLARRACARMNAALIPCIHIGEQAVNERDRPLHRRDDLSNGHLCGRTGERIAALRTAYALYKSRTPQRQHKLFEIVLRYPLRFCNCLNRYNALPIMQGKFIERRNAVPPLCR